MLAAPRYNPKEKTEKKKAFLLPAGLKKQGGTE
jgi:hypothetical protein